MPSTSRISKKQLAATEKRHPSELSAIDALHALPLLADRFSTRLHKAVLCIGPEECDQLINDAARLCGILFNLKQRLPAR